MAVLLVFAEVACAVRAAAAPPATDRVDHVIQLFRGRDALCAEVCINGTASGQFLIDTGAYDSMIDESVARRLHLHAIGTGSLAFMTGARQSAVYRVDDLKIGDVHFQVEPLFAMDFSGYRHNSGIELAGVIGESILTTREPVSGVQRRNSDRVRDARESLSSAEVTARLAASPGIAARAT
jgi:hypothetical protein